MNNEPLSRDEFLTWRRSRATQQVFDEIRNHRKELVEQLLGLEPSIRDAGITAQAYQRAKGIIWGLDYFLELEWPEDEREQE